MAHPERRRGATGWLASSRPRLCGWAGGRLAGEPVPGGQPLLDEKDVVVAVLPPLAAKHPPVEAPDLGMRDYLTYTNACRNVVKANGKMHTTCRSAERTDLRIGFE